VPFSYHQPEVFFLEKNENLDKKLFLARYRQQKNHIILMRSQSGQIHVGPLLIPHLFSSKHSLQIMNPHGQLQQNSRFCLQQ
jgi:hypothetical protein